MADGDAADPVPRTDLVGIGLAIGLGAALGLTRYIKSMLFGITPNDPLIIGVAFVGLAAVSLFAGWLPATGAARTDPLNVLRYQ